MRKSVFIGLVLLISVVNSFSQSLFSEYKSHIGQSRDSFLVYSNHIMALAFKADTINALRIVDSTIEYARQQENVELELNAQLVKANILGWCTSKKQLALKMMQDVKRESEEIGNTIIRLRTYNQLARFNFIHENYDLSFEYYLQSWPLLNSVSPDEFLEKKRNIQNIGKAFYFFNDFEQSIYFLRKSTELPISKFSKDDEPSILNTLGMSYRQLRNFDSSDYYFKAIFSLPDLPELWIALASGNLGENYVLQNRMEEAKPLLIRQLEYAQNNNDKGLMSHSAMYLAEAALRTGNLPEAITNTRYAQAILDQTKDADGKSHEPYWRFEHLFSLMSRVLAAERKTQLASLYSDSLMIAKDSSIRKFNSLTLLRAQQKIDRQNHARTLDEIKQRKITERNIFISAAVLLCIGFLFAIVRQRYKHAYQQTMQEMALQKVQNERDSSISQLQEFARHLAEKNKLIEALEAKMDDSYADAIQILQSQSALISEDWERFRVLFEKVHSGYLENLRNKVPGISPAEVRFMALAKLGFSNKEMAAAIGVSAEAIRSVWHRLRKKLELSDDTTVEDFVRAI